MDVRLLFTYKAISKDGELITGVYEASEKSQVITYIKSQRMTPVKIDSGKRTNLLDMLPKKKTAAKDMSIFCEQFCALLRAGVTILDALRLLLNQTKDKALKEGIQITIVGINEGNSLADSMSKSKAFDETLVSLVRAGEASGSLETSLERMGEQYKKDAEIVAAIKKATSYPIIVLIIAVIVVVFMLLYIVPSFMNMFKEVGIEMPKITMAVVAASDWLKKNYLIAILIIGIVIAAIVSFAKSNIGKKILSKMALSVPGINNFTIKTNASKIARTLSTLLTSGMPVVKAMSILESTLKNYYYKQAIAEVKKDVLNGQPISNKFMENDKLFPPMLSHMISVGEDTGDMASMLTRTSDYYDMEVETATQTMMSMLQPMVIILLTGIVAIILAAVLSPMVSLYSQLGDAL